MTSSGTATSRLHSEDRGPVSERVIVSNCSYDGAELRRTVAAAFDAFEFDVRKRLVLVKPNMLGPFEPQRGITTHPAVIKAVVAVLKERGAEVMVGDNPGMHGFGRNVLCAEKCGLYEASGGTFVNFSETPVEIETGSRFTGRLLVSRQVLEADLVVTVPKFKTHVVTTITGAMKNSFGFLVGGQKPELHRLARDWTDFSEAVVDVFETRVPDLALMDAVVAMEGLGPSSKDLRRVGKIIAADNCIAMDAVMAMMMGIRPDRVDMLRIAAERGLGEIRPDRLAVEGDFEVEAGFKVPSRLLKGFLSLFSPLATWLIAKRPVVDERRCKKCGYCKDQCPVDAITLDPFPVIDREKCFSCFCCQEYCQEDAIKPASSIRFIRKLFG